jgi:hypothetical protein
MAVVLLFGVCVSAFAQLAPDILGFCAPPVSVPACTNATGPDGESIGTGNTAIGMEANGPNGTSNTPWYLILALPNYTGATPMFTITGGVPFTYTVLNPGNWSSGDLYTFAGTPSPNSSLSFGNLDGGDEEDALGGTNCPGGTNCTPAGFFDVFVYKFTTGLASNTPYTLNFTNPLVNGTWLAGTDGANQFSTTNTVAGLVNGPGGPGTLSVTPEPSSIVLLATMVLGVVTVLKKKIQVRQ